VFVLLRVLYTALQTTPFVTVFHVCMLCLKNIITITPNCCSLSLLPFDLIVLSWCICKLQRDLQRLLRAIIPYLLQLYANVGHLRRFMLCLLHQWWILARQSIWVLITNTLLRSQTSKWIVYVCTIDTPAWLGALRWMF